MNELGELEKSILNDILQNPDLGRRTIATKYNLSESVARSIVRRCKQIIKENESSVFDEVYSDLLEHNSKLEKQKQRLQDQQRIERKIRNRIRTENALSDITRELIKCITNHIPQKITLKHEEINDVKTGILCLSDLHLNELIDIHGNKYDFDIAAKRLKKYVTESKIFFKSQGIKNVVIACLGDLLNSTRRTDELLNQATNLAKATLLTTLLLEQLILDLNLDFNVTFLCVSGNESRVDFEQGHSEIMVSNNHDFTVTEILKIMFRNTDIKFIGNNNSEQILLINNKHILFMHGDNIGKGDIEKKVMQIKGKYAAQNIIIDYLVFGHIHSSYIGDNFSRSSSLCGANAYSDIGLQLSSRASQMILIVSENSINGIKIDLQEYDGYEGYNIDTTLEAYNVKSIIKLEKMTSEKIIIESIK